MTRYGIDSLQIPTEQQLQVIAEQAGYTILGNYVNRGPFHTWAVPDADWWAMAAEYFADLVPYYVGQQAHGILTSEQGSADGWDAVANMRRCGFDEGSMCWLDMEYGTAESNEGGARAYAQAWAQQLRNAGFRAGLYSDTDTVPRIGHLFDGTIIADYVVTTGVFDHAAPTNGSFDPSSPPPSDGWQFGDHGTVAGIDCDYLSFTDSVALATIGGGMNVPPVPDDYQQKFGIKPDDPNGWPEVADNLEGIISQLQAELAAAQNTADCAGLQEKIDAAKAALA